MLMSQRTSGCSKRCCLYVSCPSLIRSLDRTPLTRYPVFRKQFTFDIDSHRKLGQHFGPLHKHATYAVPKRGDLDDVVGKYLPPAVTLRSLTRD